MYRLITSFINIKFKTDGDYLLRGTFWLSITKGIGLLASLASSVVFANFLPEETYGNYRYVLSILALLAIPTLNGIDTALITALAHQKDRTYFYALKTKLKGGVVAGTISLIVSAFYFLTANTLLGSIFFISAFLMPLMETAYLFVSVLNGKKDFKGIAFYLTISRTLTTLCLISVVLLTDILLVIFITYFLSHVVLWSIFSYLSVKKHIKNSEVDEEAVPYGKHLTLMNSVFETATNIDKILIFHFVGPIALAGYYLALIPFKQIKNLLSSINMLAMPKFASNDLQTLRRTLPKKIFRTYLILIPLVISYIVIAPTAFNLLFPKYTEFTFTSQLFSCLLLLYPTSILQTALTSLQLKNKLYSISISTSIVRIIVYGISIPLWGLNGAIAGVILTQVFYSSIIFYTFFSISKPGGKLNIF